MSTQSQKTMIYGGAKLSLSSAVTLQHAEHYGVISILVLLLAMHQCTDAMLPQFVIGIDNDHTRERECE